MKNIELPLGFGMALAQNESAMKKFESFTESEKIGIINQTHSLHSKSEMHHFVDNLGKYTESF